MALTKTEKQILKDFGNNPNYRIETNNRNKIVAVQLNVEKSNMDRFISGQEFYIPKSLIPQIKYRFEEKEAKILNKEGADQITVLAVFEIGFLFKIGDYPSATIHFTDIKFTSND